MRPVRAAVLGLGLALATAPAAAQTAQVVPEPEQGFSWSWSGTAYSYALYKTAESEERNATFFSGVSASLDATYVADGYTLGGNVSAYLDLDYAADEVVLDDYDVFAFVENDRLGRVDAGITGSAADYACVEPPGATDNFGHADFVTVGTCPGYDNRPLIRYTTPPLGGLQLSVSYMPDWHGIGPEVVDDSPAWFAGPDVDEPAESIALGATYATDLPGDRALIASLGVEQALHTRGEPGNGDGEPIALQVGAVVSQGPWAFGAAAAFIDVDQSDEDEWSLGAGASWRPGDGLTLSTALYASRHGEDGVMRRENSLSLLALWAAVPERLAVDGGLWLIHRHGRELSEHAAVAGLGFTVFF